MVFIAAHGTEVMTSVHGEPRSPRRSMRPLIVAVALVATGCAAAPGPEAQQVQRRPLELDETYILEGLFRAASTSLSVHPLCEELTGSTGSRTMARYIAAILAEHGPDTANWIDVQASEREGPNRWEVTFLPLSGTEEDPQLWGLEFDIRESDGIAIPESFRCSISWEGWW
jgi:hypothetical protein